MAERLSDERLAQLVALCHCTCTAQPCDCLEPGLAAALAELQSRRAAEQPSIDWTSLDERRMRIEDTWDGCYGGYEGHDGYGSDDL